MDVSQGCVGWIGHIISGALWLRFKNGFHTLTWIFHVVLDSEKEYRKKFLFSYLKKIIDLLQLLCRFHGCLGSDCIGHNSGSIAPN